MKANRRKKKYIPLRLQYDVTEGSRTESAHKGSSHGLPSVGDKPCKRSLRRWSCVAYLLRKESTHASAVGSTS
ncbi:MAG: hypothetical protein QW139_02335, partial [Candidatus Micrarchaeaceae archaeon]